MPFGKGTRQCLGINLAYGELYLGVANLYRRYGGAVDEGVEGRDEGKSQGMGMEGRMELFETDLDDVEFGRDFFIPFPRRKESKGVRVVVRPV